MTNYVGVGAKYEHNRADISTKKALKEEIATNPTNVWLYVTDAFGPNANTFLTADKADIGVRYTVTGPNPYNSRKWYATVEKLPNGKLTAK